MSRVDVPTLMCDRCGHKTQDTREMGGFCALEHHHMSGMEQWDLCEGCKQDYYRLFIKNEDTPARNIAPVSQVV